MTPLAASLIFIIIAIFVSIFRHLVFQSSSISAGDDSNIALTKIHTLTIPQQSDHKVSYNSLYQAFYQPQERREPSQYLPYNSYVLKKAILNNEDVYVCQQKFAAVFEEKTSCDGNDNVCKWKTSITVYRLPFLKKEEEQVMEVEGRVLKNGGNNGELTCNRKVTETPETQFVINFVVLRRNKQSKKGSGWTMNSLLIEEDKQAHKNSSFSLKMLKWNLKNVMHYPKIYSFDQKCLSYVTQQQPWLIYFNCGRNWSHFNILHPKVQDTLFSKMNLSNSQPPFSSTHHVTPLFLRLFKSSIKTYIKAQLCTGTCPKEQSNQSKNFITYVFQIVNSHYLLGSTVAQLTLAIFPSKPTQKQSISSSFESSLVSHSILMNQIKPQKKINIDCELQQKQINIIKGLYAYQLSLQTNSHIIATITKNSLLCICTYNYKENLNIIFFEDLLNNVNISEMPSELLVRSSEDLEQSQIQNIVKKIDHVEEKGQDQEENQWFDFQMFDYRYDLDEDGTDKEDDNEEQNQPAWVTNEGDNDENTKKEKKSKIKSKDHKKSRKSKKDKKEKDKIDKKLTELLSSFQSLGQFSAVQSPLKMLQFPMPFVLTSDSKFKIVNGDLEFPLIYIQTAKKYLLTYQPKQHFQQLQKNQTKRTMYTYKYSEIGTSLKAPEKYIRVFPQNDTINSPSTIKSSKRKQQLQLDRFLLQLIQQNNQLLNQIKSINVVDARYQGSNKKYELLKGMRKGYKKQIIVVWGWGIQVYQIDWDKKGIRNQLTIEETLNAGDQGIQMLTLLPFIELFATVYCLFQTLISPR